jgi:hypothetical protein
MEIPPYIGDGNYGQSHISSNTEEVPGSSPIPPTQNTPIIGGFWLNRPLYGGIGWSFESRNRILGATREYLGIRWEKGVLLKNSCFLPDASACGLSVTGPYEDFSFGFRIRSNANPSIEKAMPVSNNKKTGSSTQYRELP